MKIIHFCRHKTAGWEGVIYQDDHGKVFITNGLGLWEDSAERRAALELVPDIQPGALYEGLEKFRPDPSLLKLVREALAG